MKIVVAGTREDVAGFALAGVEGVLCKTGDDVERVIAAASADTLVLVSAEFSARREGRAHRTALLLPARS